MGSAFLSYLEDNTLQKMFWFSFLSSLYSPTHLPSMMSYWDLNVGLYGIYSDWGLTSTWSLILCSSLYDDIHVFMVTLQYEENIPEASNFIKTNVCLDNNSEIPIQKSSKALWTLLSMAVIMTMCGKRRHDYGRSYISQTRSQTGSTWVQQSS